jgi:hypothetical protein
MLGGDSSPYLISVMTGMSEFSILEKPTVGKWGEDFFHTDRPARSQGLQGSESGQDYRVDLLKRDRRCAPVSLL